MPKILIIEDDGDIAAIERDYLELDNFQVEIALDGITGLERGLHGAFDLILLDLMLPGMTALRSAGGCVRRPTFPSSW